MTDAFPFSAVVGQPLMKRALVLAAIHPGLGGVLIRGTKGAAKSTAVRALSAILPGVDVYAGDPFRRAPGETVEGWPLPEDAALVSRPVPIVTLPVGATEDRVVGSLNLERALNTGARSFEPGLLAAAHRGILYIDEVNLLPDHLVDLLLDSAAMGVNHVEREGLAFRHPARFLLVGTMNPEEGELRPQLLDRFGLAVDVEPMDDPALRAEVVRRRLAYEADPQAFRRAWHEADRREGDRIAKARNLLPRVEVPDDVLDALCRRCASEGAEGLRADLTIYKAASALAAYEGRTNVTTADVDAVAELALAHRRTTPRPTPPPPPRPSEPDPPPENLRDLPPREYYAGSAPGRSPEAQGSDETPATVGDGPQGSETVRPAEPTARPLALTRPRPGRSSAPNGRRGRGRRPGPARRGPTVRTNAPAGRSLDPSVDATLRASAPWQASRGRAEGGRLIVRPDDLRDRVRSSPARHLVVFVVDASRSMGARKRMAEVKGAVLSLLVDAYQKRDLVGLVTFGGTAATVALPPTRSVRTAARRLADLPVGGLTPLAHGLATAGALVAGQRRRDAGVVPLLVLLTDGRANVPLRVPGDPFRDALDAARRLASAGVSGLVVDTEAGPVRLGRARAIADALGADCRALGDLHGRALPDAVRRALLAG